MSKHQHQTKAERIYSKTQGAESLDYEKMPQQTNAGVPSETIEMKMTADDNSIRRLANQIYHEKGGTAFDNWLEAERILKNQQK